LVRLHANLEIFTNISKENLMTVQQLYEEHIKKLSLAEMRQLASLVEQSLAKLSSAERSRPKWHKIAGQATYPLAGEDAQDWVSRLRTETDSQREQQWS
jgi:hypothetical protein